ncbi:Hepatic leukemia factor [Trichinella pseudospiralis]|uniref:Hepatic leukemia factor n=1 Tax=Trichinella pseudospiralis TaxID=6337 RepID=A0A0V1FA20_TRIPS|nr:Hepatic leukemia factor [Trichinella pseudospiralis]KRY82591.1 Hepatic leukemia factor [Trichinella pseudospiralis]
MTTVEQQQQQQQQSNGNHSTGSFDPNKALKNYAANMAMSSLYWPPAAGFDPSNPTSMYAAYTQASALAAAAAAQQGGATNGRSGSLVNGGASTAGVVSTTAPTGSAILPATPPYTAQAPAALNASVQPTTTALANGGGPVALSLPAHSTTPTTPKKKAEPVPEHMKDNNYWERRKRNNESARRSRESRRIKEEQIALRVVYLEQENLQLRTELSMLRGELEKLRMILYNTHH